MACFTTRSGQMLCWPRPCGKTLLPREFETFYYSDRNRIILRKESIPEVVKQTLVFSLEIEHHTVSAQIQTSPTHSIESDGLFQYLGSPIFCLGAKCRRCCNG